MEASSDAHGVRDVGSQSFNGVLSERVVGADKDWLLPAFTIVYLILGHRGKRGKVVGLHMKHHNRSTNNLEGDLPPKPESQ